MLPRKPNKGIRNNIALVCVNGGDVSMLLHMTILLLRIRTIVKYDTNVNIVLTLLTLNKITRICDVSVC